MERDDAKRDDAGPDIVVGRRAAIEALKGSRDITRILVAAGASRGQSLSDIMALAAKRRIPLEEARRHELDDLAGDVNHQGVIVVVSPFVYASLDDVVARAGAGGRLPALAVLDEITDPRNLGAILRSADGVGLAGVVIGERRSAPVNAAAIKTAAGAEEHVPVARVSNTVAALRHLKEEGFWILGSGAEAAYPEIWTADLSGKIAVVIGGEGRGMRPIVKRECDLLVRIPMYGAVESLNASVAAALLLYELRRRLESR